MGDSKYMVMDDEGNIPEESFTPEMNRVVNRYMKEDIMLKKGWVFIKENVVAIITIVTALLTFVYAVLRLCIYVYWNGYFTRLNIDINIMNLNFDSSIFMVVFVSIVLLVVLFFAVWTQEIICDIIKKEKGRQVKWAKKIFYIIKAFCQILLLSFIILSTINIPLLLLMVAVSQIKVTIGNMILLFLLLYFMEILFIFSQIITVKGRENKEKLTERDVATKIIQVLVMMLVIIAVLFYDGTQAIDEKKEVQLVENEEYMISYYDGENYVLHKVRYDGDKITIYKNEQKIVSVEDCEVSIKQIKEIIVKD